MKNAKIMALIMVVAITTLNAQTNNGISQTNNDSLYEILQTKNQNLNSPVYGDKSFFEHPVLRERFSLADSTGYKTRLNTASFTDQSNSTILSSSVQTLLRQDSKEKDTCEELRILSWNIYMLPHLFIRTGQLKRAKEIVESLKNEDVDVIVFEEAFDRSSRNIIRNGLKNYFPYESGNPAKQNIFKANSGVWIISKIPIEVMKQIFFKNCKGPDRLASKGALLIQAKKNKFCFQLIGTHLQSDLRNKDVTNIRKIQYKKISEDLVETFAQKNIPQFVVGDMNTIKSDSLIFNQMLGTFNVKQCVFVGKYLYSYDCLKNDFIYKSKSSPQLIDYVFYNKRNLRKFEGKTSIKIFKKQWDSKHSDLSDHFAVLASFHIPKLASEEVKNIGVENPDKEPYEKSINIINPKKTIELMPKLN